MAVNSYAFNPARFAAAIPDMHPTLQQSLYRLLKECIKVMADETRRYDDRNPCVARGGETNHGISQSERKTHSIEITGV